MGRYAPQQRKDVPRDGDYWSPEPIYAFRMWCLAVEGADCFQCSPGRQPLADLKLAWAGWYGSLWRAPGLTARCGCWEGLRRVRHSLVPYPQPNTCGIYAHKEVADFNRAEITSDPVLLGMVKMWGRVIEHAHGYRAEKARCVAAFRPAGGLLFTEPWAERLSFEGTPYFGEQVTAVFQDPLFNPPRLCSLEQWLATCQQLTR
jgi:hypothetical protein